MSLHTKFWYLDNFDFFSDLTMEQRKFVHENTKMTNLKKGEIVYFEGSPSNSIYFLKEGEMRISKHNESGDEFLINIISPGSIFGMSAITGDSCRAETVKAQKPSLICILEKEKMKVLLTINTGLNIKFCRMMESRMNDMQQRLENVTFQKSEDRIIHFLKSKALSSDTKDNESQIIIPALPHESIAKLTSTSRQLVSEVFSNLKKQGIICYDRQEIKILHLQTLLEIK